MRHVVFVDCSPTGLMAFDAAKRMDCYVTFVKPLDASLIDVGFKDPEKAKAYYGNVDQYIEIASLADDLLHQTLITVNEARKIDAIMTPSEFAMIEVTRESERFGLVSPSYHAFCDAVYKDRCRVKLKDAGVRSVEFEVINEAELLAGKGPQMAYPFVIKPTRGFGKQFSAICFNGADYDQFVSELAADRAASNHMINQLISHEYLVEQYIKGTLYSVEVLVQNSVFSAMTTTVRLRSSHSEMLEMTTTMPANLAEQQNQQLIDYVAAVFKALDIHCGMYHVEVMIDEQGPVLIEVNGRIIGGVAPRLYQMLSGLDPFELLLKLHLDEPISLEQHPLKGAGTTVVVGAMAAGTVPADFSEAAFSALKEKYQVQFSSLDLYPGKECGNFAGNLSLMGYVIILADTPMQAAKRGYDFLGELEQLVGIKLAKMPEPMVG